MPSAIETRDHEEIRRWAEERGGVPTVVEGTDGLLRIDFVRGPKSGGRDPRLREVSWNDWFRIFDENDLVFLYSPKRESKFFKLVAPETVKEKQHRARKRTSRANGRAAPRRSAGQRSAGRSRTTGRSTGQRGKASTKRATGGRTRQTGGSRRQSRAGSSSR